MELSAGRAVADGVWQLSTADLSDAWIGPPAGFVGSAHLVAELQLPNSQIVDRQSIRLEWTRREHEIGAVTNAPTATPEISGKNKSPTNERRAPSMNLSDGEDARPAEPEITNSTCFASASEVRQHHPEAWPSWTLRARGHEGTKCWYPTNRTLAHDHPQ
jgi:hypothetical protein